MRKFLSIIILGILIGSCSITKVNRTKSTFYDFGNSVQNDTLSVVFTVKNTLNEPLNILGIKLSCKCGQAKINKSHLKPNQAATLKVDFYTSQFIGLQKKQIRIETDNENQKYLEYYIQTTVKE